MWDFVRICQACKLKQSDINAVVLIIQWGKMEQLISLLLPLNKLEITVWSYIGLKASACEKSVLNVHGITHKESKIIISSCFWQKCWFMDLHHNNLVDMGTQILISLSWFLSPSSSDKMPNQ